MKPILDFPHTTAEKYILALLRSEGVSLDVDTLLKNAPDDISVFDIQSAVWSLIERGETSFTNERKIRLAYPVSLSDADKLKFIQALVTQRLEQARIHEHLPNSNLGVQSYFSGQVAILSWLEQVLKEQGYK